MKKILTVVVLRSSALGTNVSFVDNKIITNNIDEIKWELEYSAKNHIEEFSEKFPEFKDAEFKVSFHESYMSE